MRFYEAMEELAREVGSAQGKFPDSRHMLCALAEELGEAVRADDAYKPGNREWLQVACCAMRLYFEGDAQGVDWMETNDGDGTYLRLASIFVESEILARHAMAKGTGDERHAVEGGAVGGAF